MHVCLLRVGFRDVVFELSQFSASNRIKVNVKRYWNNGCVCARVHQSDLFSQFYCTIIN